MRQFIFLLACFGFFACRHTPDPCPELLERRDYALKNSLDSLIFHRDEMPSDSFRSGLETLRRRELLLFYDVRHCDFTDDVTRSYYWYRGRLKFPGNIQQELEKLARNTSK